MKPLTKAFEKTGDAIAKAATLASYVLPRRRTRHMSVTAENLVLPLHGGADTPMKQALHHMAMQQSAGTNWRGDPRGFRIAPSSRKNPATHSPRPTTRLEGLMHAAKVA